MVTVVVVGDGTVTTCVCVRSKSTVFVETTISVVGDIVTLSVWIIVFGTAVWVCTIVEIMTDAAGDPFPPSVAAAPPSTGTTE